MIKKKKKKKRRVEANHDEDDSEYTHGLSMNGSTIYKAIIILTTNSFFDKINVATTPTNITEQFWKYSNIPFQTIIEQHNLLKSLQKIRQSQYISIGRQSGIGFLKNYHQLMTSSK